MGDIRDKISLIIFGMPDFFCQKIDICLKGGKFTVIRRRRLEIQISGEIIMREGNELPERPVNRKYTAKGSSSETA